jgi:hypothetical protein
VSAEWRRTIVKQKDVDPLEILNKTSDSEAGQIYL